MSSKDDLHMSDKAEHHEDAIGAADSESLRMPVHANSLTRSVLLKTDIR